jgi:hypothetical protein
MTFAITFTLTPGMLSDIKASDFSSLNDNGWMAITVLTIFSFSDFIGRYGIVIVNNYDCIGCCQGGNER